MKALDSLLARNTAWASLASLTQFGVTAIVLALLTFEFEPAMFGDFIGALSLIFFAAPFAGFGAPNLLQKRHGADGFTMTDSLSLARGMTVLGGAFWTITITALSMVLIPNVDTTMVLMLAVAELIAISYIDTCQAAIQATETLKLALVLKAAQSGLRLLALGMMFAFIDEPSLVRWSMLYMLAAIGAAVIAHVTVQRHIDERALVTWPRWSDVSEGVGLTLGWGTERLRTDADKVLLVRYGLAADAGLYGAAARMLQIAYVPIRGAVAASLARFWRGANEPGSPSALARQLVGVAGGYGVLAGVGLAITAPLLPLVLGDGYGGTTEILLWLTPLPVLTAFQAFSATALTSEGYNRERVAIVLAGTALNIVLNIILIPGSGWQGAVWATLITEVLLALALWITLIRVAPQPSFTPRGA